MRYSTAIILISLLALAACNTKSGKSELSDQLKMSTGTDTVNESASPAVTETSEPALNETTAPAAENASPAIETESESNTEPAQQMTPENTTHSTPVVVETSETNEEVTSPAQSRTRVYPFLDTFAKDVHSYQYLVKRDHYFVRGTKFKVILDAPVTVTNVQFSNGSSKSLYYYDTVYVDRGTKTALAYCEGHTSEINRQCTKNNLLDIAYPVPFEKYNPYLPEDWLFSFLDKEPAVVDANKYYLDSRSTVTLLFNGNDTTELSFDKGTGLVIRADQTRNGALIKRYDYADLASNKVRDLDVRHRTLDEIPSQEAFYRTVK